MIELLKSPVITKEPEKIARDVLVHVKKGLESLEQIIPGTSFNPDSS